MINVLFCGGFFNSASVLTKSVAEMTFRLAYVLNVTFVILYDINKIGRRAGDGMLYASLFVGREKSVRCGSLFNERTRLAPISVTTELKLPKQGWLSGAGGEGVDACLRCLTLTSMSRRFLQQRYDIRGGEENAYRHRCGERRMLRLLEMT